MKNLKKQALRKCSNHHNDAKPYYLMSSENESDIKSTAREVQCDEFDNLSFSKDGGVGTNHRDWHQVIPVESKDFLKLDSAHNSYQMPSMSQP